MTVDGTNIIFDLVNFEWNNKFSVIASAPEIEK